jgi:hypothetical protein
VPESTQTADAISAYSGPTVATRTVVSSGPKTNTTSTSTESRAKALGISSGRSVSRNGQRERSTDVTGGIAAPPTNEASTSSPVPAPAAPAAQTAISPAACSTASGSSMPRPRRSTRRPWNGAPTPPPSASAPAAAPAAAYEPVTSRT